MVKGVYGEEKGRETT